jgi:hypothetical protein
MLPSITFKAPSHQVIGVHLDLSPPVLDSVLSAQLRIRYLPVLHLPGSLPATLCCCLFCEGLVIMFGFPF